MFPCSQCLTWHPFPVSRRSGNTGRFFRFFLKAQDVSVRVFINLARSAATTRSRQHPTNRYRLSECFSCDHYCFHPHRLPILQAAPHSSSLESLRSLQAGKECPNNDPLPFQYGARQADWLPEQAPASRPAEQRHHNDHCTATYRSDAADVPLAEVPQVEPDRKSTV